MIAAAFVWDGSVPKPDWSAFLRETVAFERGKNGSQTPSFLHTCTPPPSSASKARFFFGFRPQNSNPRWMRERAAVSVRRRRGRIRARTRRRSHDEVTHLPQWRGEPTAAAAAASRPSSYVRPSAKGVRRDGEATRAHPQCYSPPPPSPPPPPHDPSLPSVSTWHGVIGSLLRPKNKTLAE